MQPHVYRDERAIIVFYGHLSNVDDLLLHIGVPSKEALRAMDAGRADERSMVQLNIDIGTLTSRVLMSMFLDHRDKDPLWVLSELQVRVTKSEERSALLVSALACCRIEILLCELFVVEVFI